MRLKHRLLMAVAVVALGMSFIAGCISPATQSKPASIQPLDTSKTAAVKAGLQQVEDLATAGLKVTVVNRECTLEGTVSTDKLKNEAGEIALGVEGVDRVVNRIQVKP